jgi:hypothetical protein
VNAVEQQLRTVQVSAVDRLSSIAQVSVVEQQN